MGLWRARSFKPDVAHVFFGIPSGPIAWLLRQLAGIPYVVFLGGRDVPRENPDPPYYSDLYKVLAPVLREIWRSAAAVVACSEGLRELALQTAPTQAFDVIPDGIDLDKFQPALRGDVSKVRILGIGRLIPRKGFDTLIRAAAALKEKSAAPFEVEIVGDGPERKALEALTEGFGLSKVVRFAGTVPYERLSERYANADIYALTSHAEGMPLVVLEAMATGLPIVATDVQGMDELVTDGVNGRRFRVDDANALAIHLAELVDDAGTRRAFGAASRERVEVYSWGNVAEAYLEVLSKATRR
ncbi:MAG: glycosyltransferase [Candidatus Poribacteria bacterium]|nr:glycosyltransferase [Candidatus Poribacteria bacterium]